MSADAEKITPFFVRKLELAADQAFDLIVQDIMSVDDGVYDYPVGALALDETASLRLGKGVSMDARTGTREAHAELNALLDANSSSFEAGIVVTTMESCVMCQTGITHQLGHGGLIAYVTSRTVPEGLGHVNPRPTTHDDSIEGTRSLQLLHPRLQNKGRVLFRELTTRNRETGVTTINAAPLQTRFAKINQKYPFTSKVGRTMLNRSA